MKLKNQNLKKDMNQIQIFDHSFKELFTNGVQFLKISTEDVTETREELKRWVPSSTSKLSCSYCKTEFDDIIQQREHYKLDWHRYNLKQNLLLKPPVTEEEFNDRADDVSSISGSDSEKEEDSLESIATLQGKLFLKNSEGVAFSLYRCLLFEKKEELYDGILLKGLQKLYNNSQWTILMLGGGHFAGGVFQAATPILHKTFHAYIVRAGQGGSQSSKDNRSGCQPKSAGASLRRYNELTLTQHIHDILRAWKPEIDKSSVIIYRATGPFNQSVLFGGKVPILDRSDSRLKTIPFVTKRPTFKELKRVHALLTTTTIYESHDQVSSILKQDDNVTTKRSKTKTSNINRAKSRELVERPSPIKLDEIESPIETGNDTGADLICYEQEISLKNLQPFEDSLTPEERKRLRKKPKKHKSKSKRRIEEDTCRKKQMFEFIVSENLEKLEGYLNQVDKSKYDTEEDSNNLRSINDVLDRNGNTLLHVAALHQKCNVLRFLLENDADPCLRNQKLQTPYSCTQDQDVRMVFKNFAQEFPEKYNYTKAQIPIPIPATEEQLEKRKAQRKFKKEKDKEKKKQMQLKEQEQTEKQRFLNLSDREKRALAAERRILIQNGNVAARCFVCAADISGKVPFEYSGNRFCSMDCLKAHRLSSTTVLSL